MPSQQLQQAENSTEDTAGAYRSTGSKESADSILRQEEVLITSAPAQQDSLLTAAGITVAFRVLGWLISLAASTWLYSLFAYLMTSGLYLPSAMFGVRLTSFILSAVLALTVGVVVGRVAPRQATAGIAIGSGMGWAVLLLVALIGVARVNAAALTSPFVANFVVYSLLSVVTVTTTEILIARWMARKQLQ